MKISSKISKNSGVALAVTASLSLGLVSGCASPGKRTAIGAGAGTVTGAAIGGAIGGGKGAAIGAIAGAATGAAVGNYLDKQANELAKVAETKRVANGIVVNLQNDLLFEVGSANLKNEAVGKLGELGDILAKYPEDRIRIGGHTDNTGTDSFNVDLSRRRADSVSTVLSDRGVKPQQMIIQAYGEEKPVADNSSTMGRQQNRRVELVIDIPKEKAAAVERKSGSKAG